MQQTCHNVFSNDLLNISDYLRFNAERFPDKPALLYPDKITYKELNSKVDLYSYYLDIKGIKMGTKTVMMVPAGMEFFTLVFALLRIGALPVMIDPGMGIKAMAKALASVKPDAFIGILKAHLLRLFYPNTFISVRNNIITGFQFVKGIKGLNKLLKDKPVQFPTYSVEDNSVAAIFFTSGSTGQPKGVIYTPGMLKNQIRITRSQFRIGSDEIDLCTFPLLGLFAICHGTSSVIADMDMVHPSRLDPVKVIKNINDFGCTQMFGSPLILDRISEYGAVNGVKLPSLRRIISAGAPVHKFILESFSRMIDKEANIHTTYGATEALPVTDILASELLQINPDETENETGICIGYPIEGMDVRIIKISDVPINSWKDANQMPVTEIGEIVVKGAWVTTKYLDNEDANRLSKIFDENSNEIWHRMGDLGRMDRKGRLWFVGRKSQRVITADRTLFTIPCEAVYNQHPCVARSALVGVPADEPDTKRPVICIQLKPGFHPGKRLSQELSELGCSNNLTKEISDIVFFKKFPVDPRHNAKIFRERLARWAANRMK